MKKMSSKIETLIIGAGPSGLACAIQCHKDNKPFLLIEQSDRVGGRVGSFEEDGFIFDLGFQVYNTAYEVTNSLLDI
ncbi:MAG: NAD(P)-binding protein, partial [Candidatus Neomarinimicrobiota bacterium]